MKFIPEISRDRFLLFLTQTKAYELEPFKILDIWESISNEIYAYQTPYGLIGLPDKGGLSSYYSSNITESDAKFIQEFLESIDTSSLNTRVIKQSDDFYQILISSYNSYGKSYEYKGKKIVLLFGDFNEFNYKLIQNLKEAAKFTANEHQDKMLKAYIKHFTEGNVKDHIESQRHWIKDKGPIIETNIGFIEHYLDPMKYRGEFEGLVAVVNKEQSKLLGDLVDNAEDLLKKLTWPAEFERETFSKPDFTSLDVLTMATFGTPVGINLPNYDEIRTKEGFKNVNLGNCYPTPSKKTAQFLKEDVVDNLVKHGLDGLFVQVAIHELLGHGSGTLFTEDKDGKLNFDNTKVKNPLNGNEITTWYKASETWNSKFGGISAGYEECRADSIGLYLATFNESLKILCPGKEEDFDNILFAQWTSILINGIRGLMFYSEEAKKWGQAHIMGRYAILKVCMEAGKDFVKIEEVEKDGNPYVYLNIDKSQIRTTGREAIGEFIKHLQVYKTIADVENGEKFFNRYLEVDETFLKYRKIALRFRPPRPLEVQNDVLLHENGEFEYVKFDVTAEGVIKSHVFHHRDSYADVYPIWKEHQNHFRYKSESH